MKTINSKKVVLGLAAIVAAMLTACGGGSTSTVVNGSTSTTVITPTTFTKVCADGSVKTSLISLAAADAQCPRVSTIVTTVAAPTYAVASEELSAYSLLNAQRTSCGFGSLAQNSMLDAAALAHNDYQLRNNVSSHYESATLFPLGFTGVTPTDRVLAQGYTNAGDVGDEYSINRGRSIKTGEGADAIRGLLNAPYHLMGLMTGFREVGISVRSNTDVGTTNANVYTHLNLAYKAAAGQQLIASGEVKTYPCEGSVGLNRQLQNETPNPVPGRNLATTPLGTAIYVQVRDGDVLTLTSASLTQISTGLPVVLRTPMNAANDPNEILKGHQAFILADSPMAANASFQAIINGTNNGVAFSRTFTFTTGSGG